MIKFQQSQALTSHFESFWSIVDSVEISVFFLTCFLREIKFLIFGKFYSDGRRFHEIAWIAVLELVVLRHVVVVRVGITDRHPGRDGVNLV